MSQDEIPPAPICRVFPFETGDGPENMARDEAMLAFVAEDPSAPAVRVYGWKEPTLSLGYFQSYHEALSDPRWLTVPIVRRPTGGGAIWHDHELTYAVVVPPSHPFARRTEDLYHEVHRALSGLFGETQSVASKGGAEAEAAPLRPFLCFADHTIHDVLIAGTKVVGSAQRRRKGVVLQHGSILLRKAAETPEFLGVIDHFSNLADTPDVWLKRVTERICAVLASESAHEKWPNSLLRRAAILEQEVYRDETWTRRR